MWPFRRSETPPDGHGRHTVVLDLIEQVSYMRGQINALEDDWKKTKEQVKKDYQRVEKANERQEKRKTMEGGNTLPDSSAPRAGEREPVVPLHGFAKKLQEMKGA